MFCPQCGSEYREGVTTCTECGVALVAERPQPPVDEAEWVEPVTVMTSSSEAQLIVARSLLEAEGIDCRVEPREIREAIGVREAGTDPTFPIGSGRIQVRPEDAEAARELLAAEDLLPLEGLEDTPEA